jgi:hypothetical protein
MESIIKISIGELIDKGIWSDACNLLGLDEWCVNEGRASLDDTITITSEQAKELRLIV